MVDECPCGCHKAPQEHQALGLLEKYHQFPCDYMFKIIGFAGPDFQDLVRRAAESVLGPLSDPQAQVSCRPSSGGRYLSVTLELNVADASQVLAIYAALKQVQGVVVLV